MKNKLFKIKGLILVFCCVLMISPSGSLASSNFSDISRDYWAYREIQYLTGKQVIKGYSDNRFRPGQEITRKQAAYLLSRALRLNDKTPKKVKLKDVFSYTPGYKEILSVLDAGIFHTYGGKFLPDEKFTREDMAKALAVSFDFEGANASTFSDVPYSYRYYKYIDGIAANNVTTGYSDGTFRPKSAVTRAQFSAFLARIYMHPLNYEVKQDGKIIYSVRDRNKAIELALANPGATVHPANDTLNQYTDSLPEASSTGIQNGVLIYNGDEITNYTNLTKDFFKPYLAYEKDGQYLDTMFDSFILLGRKYSYGEFTESKTNHANYGDWEWYINRTLDENGAVAKLNAAVEEIPIVDSTNVFLTIPYPKKYEDIYNLQGVPYKNSLDSRYNLVKWYVDEVVARMEQSTYNNTKLKGFYWLNETVTNKEDEMLLKKVSNYAKSKGLKLIYSPHALSTNYEYWKTYGFDGAFLQSNAHKMKYNEEEVRTLVHKAFIRAQTRNSSLNLEIENHSANTIYQGLDNFKIYLEIAKLYNLPGRSFILYQGTEMINRLATFDTPHHQEMYNTLYEFMKDPNKASAE